jgi:hypothetical protein
MSSRAAGGFVCGVVFAIIAQANADGTDATVAGVEAAHTELTIPVASLPSVKTELKGLPSEFWADAALVRPIGSSEEALQWQMTAGEKLPSAAHETKLQMRLSSTQAINLSGSLKSYIRSDEDVTCAGALDTCMKQCATPPAK